MDFSSFFNDLGSSFNFLFSWFYDFISFMLSKPVTYYALFVIVCIPAIYFLIDFIQEFIMSDSSKSNFRFYKSNFKLSLPAALSPLKNRFWFNRSQAKGRLYKTQTVEMNGKKYRFVTSYKPRHDVGEKFNFTQWVKNNH